MSLSTQILLAQAGAAYLTASNIYRKTQGFKKKKKIQAENYPHNPNSPSPLEKATKYYSKDIHSESTLSIVYIFFMKSCVVH